MEKRENLIIAGIIIIILITFLGFFKPYFSKMPSFENVHLITHFHLIAFTCWFAVLIWQPILIQQKKLVTHKKVGRFTYFLVVILFVTIVLMVINQLSFYDSTKSNESIYISMLGGSLSGLFFITYYIIAMLKSKNTRWHVAFIIASSLVLLNPGLGRMIAALSDRQTGLLVMIITPYLVLLCILFFEKIKYKRPILKSPFALIFLLFMMEFFLFALIVSSKFWRDFIDKLAASY
ncbi:MAG: hypothetical protein H0X63_07375 [Flavobacteriales bacterium]|nr:hypothetical protein [Flavobacteriales bacterium]